MIPLFERFPGLKGRLPYVSLCQLPTPIVKLDNAGKKMGLDHLYMKQDGLTAQPFGGNKIRKLEFLLGDALERGAREVMTFGFAGSNHAAATAVFADHLGMKSISMLMPQSNAHYVRRNLLLSWKHGAELHQYANKKSIAIGSIYQLLRHRLKTGKKPYIIPPGGSSGLGSIGFVNAAFELHAQVQEGLLPEPDRIYVTLGSAGTAAGLLVGIKALNMRTRIIPVRVVEEHFTDEAWIGKLFRDTAGLLHASDPSFPHLELAPGDIDIVDDYLGEGYARFTPKGMEAAALFAETEGIKLDGTYTGKTAAALIDHARRPGEINKNDVVVYWNTLNARDISSEIENMDYHELPREFHRYFEQEVQPLDHLPGNLNSPAIYASGGQEPFWKRVPGPPKTFASRCMPLAKRRCIISHWYRS
jgi:D-cysteine desulfhydrase